MDQDNSIDPRLLERGFTDEQIQKLQQQLSIKTRADIARSLNLRLSGDLSRFKYDNFSFAVNMHNAFEKHGILPYNGPYTEQPAQIIEIFNVLDQLSFERREKQHRENQKERKKNV